MSDEMDELRRQVEALTAEKAKQEQTAPKKRKWWNVRQGMRARTAANREFYQQQKAAAPTDNGSIIGWVIGAGLILLLLWAVSAWYLDSVNPKNENPAGAPAPTVQATTEKEPTPTPTATEAVIDGFGPQAPPSNAVPSQSAKPLPAPMKAPANPAKADDVMTSFAISWLSRTQGSDSWVTAAQPFTAEGLISELKNAPMVESALKDAGSTAVQKVQLKASPEDADAPTRTTRKAEVTVATSTGQPLVFQLTFTAYLDGAAWKVSLVEETSYTGKTS